MRRKDKKQLLRIIISAALLATVWAVEQFALIPKLVMIGSFDLQALILFLIPYLVIGYNILWRALRNILRGQVFDENFLMSIATIGAFVTGEYAEAVFVMLFYQVGELFEHIAVGKSRKSIKSLLSIRADTAFAEGEDGELSEIPCEEIKVGDIICVKAGGKIPLDGVIVEGKTSLNTVALTGESVPRDVNEGDTVLSGCINVSGFIKIKVTKPFEESTVSKILALVESSTANKAKSEEFITRFARVYTPIVVISAALLALLPPLFTGIGDFAVWKDWIYRAMTFLVISCPCALVISVPLSYFGGIGSASTRGILIKGSNYLDALSSCDTVVFDKTGTLTDGVFEVAEIIPEKQASHQELLALAASAEKYSTHPISMSIRRAYEAQKCDGEPAVTEIEEVAGRGVKAIVDKNILFVGNLRLMQENGIDLPEGNENGLGTCVYLALGGEYLGRIIITDRPKAGAAEAIEKLRKAGIKRTVMLTGDRENEAQAVAEALGIDEYRAELLPQDKVGAIESLIGSAEGKIAFVGDGINDAPVLARSDVGIAMGALGSDAAIEAADIVLMNDDLQKISDAILLSRRTRRIVTQNIIFALGVKIAVLILGALGIVGLNAAVFADVGVAVIAILNSMRNLRK
ncbi:MAG: cadmium-translocating P-type ATPase [Clostridia bacterium]|nr:cadmium-translocating P-type ATPase [Clostridia bacterium]